MSQKSCVVGDDGGFFLEVPVTMSALAREAPANASVKKLHASQKQKQQGKPYSYYQIKLQENEYAVVRPKKKGEGPPGASEIR